jgi:hypothetical protein
MIKKAAYQQVSQDTGMDRPLGMKSMSVNLWHNQIIPSSYVQSHVANVTPT